MNLTHGSSDIIAYPGNGKPVWRAPQVRELRNGHRQELVFLHAKGLANALAAKLGGVVQPAGKGWKCRCPAHADAEPSLHLEDAASGMVLASCFPCGHDPASRDRLVSAIADLGYALSPPREPPRSAQVSTPKKRIVASYGYDDALGELTFEVVRYEPKDFKQRRPDGNGGWIWDTKGCPVLPYRLPEVLEAISTGVMVFVLEGERDVDTAFGIRLVATCNARGAGKWTDEHSVFLRGADVVLIPDNDEPGRDHVAKIAKSLQGKASRIRIVELLGAKDLSDWIAAGHTVDELRRLVEAAEVWDPDTSAKPAPPPLQDAKADPKKSDERRTQATTLIEIATRKGVELFHAPDGTPYADITIDGHRETWALKSNGFRRWLKRAFYEETDGAPNSDAMSTAMGIIEAKAHYDGKEHEVHLRIANCNDRVIYLDLCDRDWRVVEIDCEGWRIVSDPPVRFRRTAGMHAIPAPVEGGTVHELRNHFHLPAEEDATEPNAYILIVAWLLAVLRGRGPYPILALTGEQGTGKSLTAEMLRSLLDPRTAGLRSLPRDTRDLYVAAINGYVLVFDNLSGITAEIADALCRLSTGGGFATRGLYTDDTEVLFDGQRPIAMTSITDVASRSDLADRTAIVDLAAIPEEKRKTESELREAFYKARPRILGGLLDIVAHGLHKLPTTSMNRLPRMADFALWVKACEEAVWTAGMFMAAYEVNREDAVDIVLDSDVVAAALRRHMESRSTFEGTATELLRVLDEVVGEKARRGKFWPHNGQVLSGQLKRLAPALRKAGIAVDIGNPKNREPGTGRRFIRITTTREEVEQ